MNFKGKLIHKGIAKEVPTQNGTAKKIEFVVEKPSNNPEYPERALFTMFKTQDWVSDIDNLPSVGSEVEVEFSFKANEGRGNYEGRWFGEVSAFKVNVLSDVSTEEGNDLPF